jgi:two-component system, NarL family, invasion response regulator UvrY
MGNEAPWRIFVVDDHPAVREGLALLLEQRGVVICGDADDAAQALTRLDAAQPDVVLVDLSLQRGSGLALIEQLHLLGTKVLVYSMHDDAMHIKRAFAAGANGYVTKREGADILVKAIGEVIAGQRYVSERTRNALIDGTLDSNCADGSHSLLSDREMLVLERVGEGDSSEQIAQKLHISSHTVQTYCSRIIEKLRLAGMKELRRYAIQQGRQRPGSPP